MAQRYIFAGRAIESTIALPELPEDAGSATPAFRIDAADTRLFPPDPRLAWHHDFQDTQGQTALSCARAGSDCYFRFPDVAEAHATATGEIRLWREPGASDAALRHVLLDQILPRLLAQRGHLVLHGSAVRSASGRTFVMLGDSGHGKSTLAGALVLSGGQLLTDDCVLIDFADDAVRAVPSYPGLRLWPDSLATLFAARADQATPMAHYSDKQRLPMTDAATAAPAAVDAIVVLQRPASEPDIALTPLPAPAACMALVRNSFQLDLGDHGLLARHLTLTANAAARVPVLGLSYPRDYDWLPRVIDALEQSSVG